MQKKYPFKFLDSYTKKDADFFFGRKDEIDALYKLIFQTRILVVFGSSGTGKTSLIQCGLANKFKSYDWLALNIRRGSNLNSSLDKALCDQSNGAFTYVDQKVPVIEDLTSKIKAVHKAAFRPIYLIFDQFEELYVLGDKKEQQNFINYVQEILTIEQPVKIIISVREEYLGFMYEFEKRVPQLFRKKLRVEPMTLDKVTNVMKGINDYENSLVHIKKDEIDEITEGIFERLKGDENTLTIQLPYLQVFLDKLYFNITKDEDHEKETTITLKELGKVGNFDDVMKDFLEDQVMRISKELSSKKDIVASEKIWSILSHFCTLEGTKEPISKEELNDRLPSFDKGLIDNALVSFEKRRIVKKNEDLYELAHDSLALKIAEKRSEDDISKLEVKRLIVSKASLKGDLREFFTEKQLHFIEPYEENLKSELSNDEKYLINDSKNEIENRRKERERLEQQEKLDREEAEQKERLEREETERQERLERENKEREERLERENKERRERLKREKAGRKRRRVYRLVGLAFLIILVIRGIIGEIELSKSKIEQHTYIAKEVFTTTKLKMDQANSFVDRDPTVALQLDLEALLNLNSLDSLEIMDSLKNKTYGRIYKVYDYARSRLGRTDQIQDKYDAILNRTGLVLDSIKIHADSILKLDHALYKRMVKDTTLEDIRFVNLIFPDPIVDSIFNVWSAKPSIIDTIKGNPQLSQVVFLKEPYRAMALYKDGNAGFWNSDGQYTPVDNKNAPISSIAPIKYKQIGYKMLTAIGKNGIEEWDLRGTKRISHDTIKVNYKYPRGIEFNNKIVSISISPNREMIFTASDEGLGNVWIADTSAVELKRIGSKRRFLLRQDTILCSAFSNDGSMIVTGSKDHSIKIWNAQTNELIQQLNGHVQPVNSVAFSAKNKYVYSGSIDGEIRRWILPVKDSILPLRGAKKWNKEMSFEDLFKKEMIDTIPYRRKQVVPVLNSNPRGK